MLQIKILVSTKSGLVYDVLSNLKTKHMVVAPLKLYTYEGRYGIIRGNLSPDLLPLLGSFSFLKVSLYSDKMANAQKQRKVRYFTRIKLVC